MCVGDNSAILGLTIDFCQPDNWYHLRVDKVFEDVSWPNRGQLVHITDQNHPHVVWNSLQERIHEVNVDHRQLIDNQNIPMELVVLVKVVSSAWFGAKESVNGPRLHACGLTHPVCGFSSRSRQQNSHTHLAQRRHDAVRNGSFTRTRATSDNHNVGAGCFSDGITLNVVVFHVGVHLQLLNIDDAFLNRVRHFPFCLVIQGLGHVFLCVVEFRKENVRVFLDKVSFFDEICDGVAHQLAADAQKTDGFADKGVHSNISVSIITVRIQCVDGCAAQTKRMVLRESQSFGNLVSS